VNKIVFDASALLVLLNQEHGYEKVEQYISKAIMSAVNVSETISVLFDFGISLDEATQLINSIINEIIPFGIEHATETAELKKLTKPYGLSLGDRACLSLAKIKKLPVLTANKIWSKINHKNLNVILIR
jgi:ribonuclease VapC